MKITSFIYCLNSERKVTNDGKTDGINALGVLSALTPEFVPGTFSFSIIFSILDIDESINNIIKLIIKKSNEKILLDSGEITLPPNPEGEKISLPKEYSGFNLSMDFRNMVFEEEGLYTTQVFHNGELLSDNPIYVKGKR